MLDALDVHRSLLGREIAHEIVRLPRAVVAADEIAAVLELPAYRCVAVRLYLADDRLAAVLMPAGQLPAAAAVLSALGARSLLVAPVDLVNRRTDFAASLVCPALLPAGMPVLADVRLEAAGVVYTATGDSATALGIAVGDLLAACAATVLPLAPRTRPGPTVPDTVASRDDATTRRH